jgi:hypothetical protein
VLLDGIGHRAQHDVPDQVPVRIIDRLEVINVDQRHRQRAIGPVSPLHLGGSLRLPSGRVQQPSLGVDPGLSNKLLVHHESSR